MSQPTSSRSSLAEALRGWPPPVLDPHGPFSNTVSTLAWVLLALAVLVFLFVCASLWVALHGSDGLRAKLGGEKVVKWFGLIIPAGILALLLAWGTTMVAGMTAIRGDEPRMRVSGNIYWWRVSYLDAQGREFLADANELHIPVGRPVVVDMVSEDVIHSFWVPKLGGKMDMVPGRTNRLKLQADRAGTYAGQCAEFCGGAHSLMGFLVVAHEPADWERWLQARRVPPPAPAQDTEAARGARLFQEVGCAACHRVAGTAAQGLSGPDLTRVGSRLSLGAGILPNNRGALAGWIGDSQAIKPNNRMPAYRSLGAAELNALAAYLESLRLTAGTSPGPAGAARDPEAKPSETGFDVGLYARFPTRGERPPGEFEALQKVWATPTGIRRFSAVNNNFIGLVFVVTAFCFFLGAGVLALVMRVQLAAPLAGIVPQETFNQLFTMHGSVMMFLFAVPAVEAMAVLLLPQMLAARDLPFPRLSAYSFWAYFIGGTVFFCSVFFSLAPSDGWFMYPPLSSSAYSKGINADFWLLGIGFIEISAIAGAIELIVGVLRTRAPGMSLVRMPVFAWAILIFGVMVILAFPAMILVTLLLELERAFNWPLFDPTRGGDPLLYQHLFWFFGHPDVYIIFIPASAMVSTIVAAVAQKRLVGHEIVVLAMVATAFISFGVWAHHMFTVGLPHLSAGYFSAASMAVAIPAGAQVFAWIATLAAGKVQRNMPALFLVGGILIFVMGGLTGVMVGMVAFDGQAHDTYFVVAHFHYVLIGGMLFPLFAGFYYWLPSVTGRRLSERTGRWVFWLMFTGVHVCFLPMHLAGLMGMPRRVDTYLPGRAWELPNLVSTVGAFVMAAGVLLFVVDAVVRHVRAAPPAENNPFRAGTLEWLPAGNYSSRSIPVVDDLEPLWADPRLADDVQAGRYFLPGTATGARETLITSTLRAEPLYVQIMPGPSWWPFLAALFTAGFFLLLTMKALPASAACGVLTLACLMRWLWENDRHLPREQEQVDAGAGILLPTYVAGPQAHGWWAAVLLDIVLGMIFLMAVFAYLYLLGGHPEWWRIPAPRGALVPGVLLLATSAALAYFSRPVMARMKYGSGLAAAMLALAAACLAGALAVDLADWWRAGLRGAASAQGATVYAMMGWHGAIVAAVLLSSLFYLARWMRGLAPRPANKTLEALRIFFLYAALEGAVSLLLPRFVTGGAA